MAMSVRHTSARLPVALGSLALVLATACAGAGGAGLGGGTRLTPGTTANGQFAPVRPAAERYGRDAGGACQTHGVINYVMSDLAERAKLAARPAPVLDPGVCGAAEAFLGWQDAAPPRPAVLAFVSRWFGLPGVISRPIVATFETPDERLIAERVVQAIGGSAANAVQPRLGLAVQRTRKGKVVSHRVSVVLLDAPIELDPLPRRLAAGEQATLSGKLLGGVTNPKVLLSDAAGRLSTPQQAPGDAFRAELSCGDRPGRIQVEIRGEYEGREGGVASFPVACAEELPARVAIAPEPWPTDQGAAERRILELVNEERKAAGLEPLAWDAALAGVARSISSEIASRGGAAGGADVAERLKKEGIASPLVLQSAAAERSFERAHERLMDSPTNRANIMNAEATHGGVGAVPATDAQGQPLVYVTEIFIRELPPVDLAKARQALRDAVAQKRKDARTNAVASDPRLDEIAQTYAEAVAATGGALPKEKHAELTAPLNKDFKTVTMISGAKQEALDFAEESQATAPGKALGVGVAQGKHPVLGRNATYVVLMVGTPRAAAPASKLLPRKKK
jgi:uncharacterized protein YkwD